MTRRGSAAAGAAALLLLAGGLRALAGGVYEVRQKNRRFQPHDLEIRRGETVRIINDDGELLHHAYVQSPDFSFDSGEQEPGTSTDIVFTKAGTFAVMCGIHPKMRLNVVVR